MIGSFNDFLIFKTVIYTYLSLCSAHHYYFDFIIILFDFSMLRVILIMKHRSV